MVPAPFTQSDFDAFLTDISTPFMERDVTLWRARIVLPFSMVTATGPVTLRNDDDVKENFDHYIAACDAMRLDLVSRDPVGFEICDAENVIATYRTNLLSHGTRVTPPYTSSALLQHTDGTWKMSAILNALGHHHWTGRHPNDTGDDT